MRIVTTSTVKIRKQQNCDACFRNVPKGSQMWVAVVADAGQIWRWRQCPTCTELLSKHTDVFSGGQDAVQAGVVANALAAGQTPEELLNELNKSE